MGAQHRGPPVTQKGGVASADATYESADKAAAVRISPDLRDHRVTAQIMFVPLDQAVKRSPASGPQDDISASVVITADAC